MQPALAVIFVATIAALYVRPFGVRDWQAALAGALLAWAVGPVSFGDGLLVVRHAWNILAFFAGLMLISAGAEASGLYGRAAELLERARGTRSAVALVLLLGTGITAVLSNDATPLVLTPAVFAAARAAGRDPLPPAFAATFAADGASLLLPISNPVNLLFVERFDIGLGEYARMILPAAAAGVAALAAVAWLMLPRGAPRPSGQRHAPLAAKPGSLLTAAALASVAVLAAVYIGAGAADAPLGLVTLGGGLVLLGETLLLGGPRTGLRRHLQPGVLIFVAALLLLVECVSQAGLLDRLTDLLDWLGGRPGLAAVAGAVLANLLNNWPAALLLAAAVAGAQGEDRLVAGALIGCTIGANFTVVGSLSTVFWVSLGRSQGARVAPGDYARRAFLPTLTGLTAAVAVAAVLER